MLENRTIFTGDNLDIMRGLESASVDLIYLDPPFNSNHNYAAPIGSKAAGAAFKDSWTWNDIDKTWQGLIGESYPALHNLIETAGLLNGKSDKAYLVYMSVRIMEMHRLLKSTGSLYLHCDPTMSHSLKLTLDAIFGAGRLINEISWIYKSGGASKRWFAKKHDTIFFYTKTKHYTFNTQKEKSYMGIDYNTGNKNVKLYDDKDGLGKYTLVNAKDWWYIGMLATSAKERTGYPTQKPLEILRRIVRASSHEGDMVLDPFCGCATTCLAAEELKRQWIGIDISPLAADLIIQRLENELGLFGLGIHHRKDIPPPIEKRSKNIRHILYHEQNGQCAGCKDSRPIQKLEVDHVIPKSKRGIDADGNLQLLCSWCNRTKGDRDMPYLIKRLREEGLMND